MSLRHCLVCQLWTHEPAAEISMGGQTVRIHERHLAEITCACGKHYETGGHLRLRRREIVGYECPRCTIKRNLMEGDVEALPLGEPEAIGAAPDREAHAG